MSPWRIFSQQGLRTGISSSPQHKGLSILGSQAIDPEELQEDFGCCCKNCSAIYTSLRINLDASDDAAPGHTCCDAEFCLFLLDFQKTNTTGQDHWIYLGRANLNSYFCSRKNSPPEIDDIYVGGDLLEEASLGKTPQQCCELKFLYIGAPYPESFDIKTSYSESVNLDGTYDNRFRTNYGPVKSIGLDVTIEPRNTGRVHGDITIVTVYDGNEQILKRERFNAQSTKIVNVCDCPEGYIKNEVGECTQDPDSVVE